MIKALEQLMEGMKRMEEALGRDDLYLRFQGDGSGEIVDWDEKTVFHFDSVGQIANWFDMLAVAGVPR